MLEHHWKPTNRKKVAEIVILRSKVNDVLAEMHEAYPENILELRRPSTSAGNFTGCTSGTTSRGDVNSVRIVPPAEVPNQNSGSDAPIQGRSTLREDSQLTLLGPYHRATRKTYLLIAMDYFTKWPEVYAITKAVCCSLQKREVVLW